MGLSEETRRAALEEVDVLWELVKEHPEYRPNGLLGGLGVVRGLLNCGLSSDQWAEVLQHFGYGGDGHA